MFAVIKTGGKQYKVAANDVLKIEKLAAEAGDIVTFDQVLMVGNGDSITTGTPLVAGALVAAELLETKKQKTIIVLKKNRRHNYRRRNGHRQLLTSVRITEILVGGAKPTIKARVKKVAAPVAEVSDVAPKQVKAKAPVVETPAAVEAATAAKAPAKKPAAKAPAQNAAPAAKASTKKAETTTKAKPAAKAAAAKTETKPKKPAAAKKAGAPKAEDK
jgi:large subunit ribosomal protein L21